MPGVWRSTWHQLFLVRSSAWVSYDGRHPSLPLNSQRLPVGGAAGSAPPELLLGAGRSLRWRPHRGVSSSHSGTVLPPGRLWRCRETFAVVTAGGGGAVGISWRAAPGAAQHPTAARELSYHRASTRKIIGAAGTEEAQSRSVMRTVSPTVACPLQQLSSSCHVSVSQLFLQGVLGAKAPSLR